MSAAVLATCLILSVGRPALAAEGPTSVVVVAPVVSGNEASRQAAAAMLSDRLAEHLGAMASVKVVDRTQIDRVLRERATSGADHGPVLSFDLILRVREDIRPLTPALVVELVDLSLGNVAGSWRLEGWDGAITDAQVAQAAAVVRQTIEAFGTPAPRPVAVRLLGVGNPERSVRLDPLAAHLVDLMAATVEKSPRCRRVQHLEALTAKEESLFLLVGLSRLAGGRQFLPQADLKIEATLREVDGVGRTFDETPLELSWWTERRGDGRGEPRVLREPAGRWPELAGEFCRALAADLGEASPVPFGDYATEMARRRRQALAELAAAENEIASDPGADRRTLEGRLPTASGGFEVHPAYARIAAAAKLDPTCEQAAYLLAHRSVTYGMMKRAEEPLAWSVRQCLDYLERFPDHAEHRKSVLIDAIVQARGLYLFDLDRGAPPLSPLKVEMLDVFQAVLERLPPKPLDMTTRSLAAYHAGTLCALRRRGGASRDERVAWLDRYRRRFEQSAGEDQIELVIVELEMALDDGDLPAARAAAGTILTRPLPVWESHPLEYPRKVYGLLERIGDEAYLTRFREWFEPQIEKISHPYGRHEARRWLAEKFPKEVERPPDLGPSPEERERRHAEYQQSRNEREWRELLEPLDARDRTTWDLQPLLVHGGWLYLARGSLVFRGRGNSETRPPPKGELLRMRVDARGRALGKPEPLPGAPRAFSLAAVAASGTRVYFSLLGDGLYEFDTATDAWRTWGAKDGLPTVRIRDIVPLGDGDLLLSGRVESLTQVLVRLNTETGAVTLLRRSYEDFPDLRCLWPVGDRWLSLNGHGRVVDGLGGGLVGRFPARPGSWEADNCAPSSAVVGGRRWVVLAGLYEIDPQGKVVHSYLGKRVGRHVAPPFSLPSSTRELRVLGTAKHLVLVTDYQVACYDPAGDTWYGPLGDWSRDFRRPVAAPGGLWLHASRGPGFIDLDRFIAEARSRGLARKSARAP